MTISNKILTIAAFVATASSTVILKADNVGDNSDIVEKTIATGKEKLGKINDNAQKEVFQNIREVFPKIKERCSPIVNSMLEQEGITKLFANPVQLVGVGFFGSAYSKYQDAVTKKIFDLSEPKKKDLIAALRTKGNNRLLFGGLLLIGDILYRNTVQFAPKIMRLSEDKPVA